MLIKVNFKDWQVQYSVSSTDLRRGLHEPPEALDRLEGVGSRADAAVDAQRQGADGGREGEASVAGLGGERGKIVRGENVLNICLCSPLPSRPCRDPRCRRRRRGRKPGKRENLNVFLFV